MEFLRKLWSTLVSAFYEMLPAAFYAILAVIFYALLDTEEQQRWFVFIVTGIALFPVRYRKAEDDRYIRIPYLFAGFCELGVVVFDRIDKVKK